MTLIVEHDMFTILRSDGGVQAFKAAIAVVENSNDLQEARARLQEALNFFTAPAMPTPSVDADTAECLPLAP